MKCFRLVKSVLDEEYAVIPGNTAEKDKAIRERLVYLRGMYRHLGTQAKPQINYSDPVTRFAYIYKYVTPHADYVCSLIESAPSLRKLFGAAKVNVSCIGGGPGSDLVGVLKFVERSGKQPSLRFTLLDREPAWSESWSDVDEKLSTSLKTNVNFQPFDVSNEAVWKLHRKYFNSEASSQDSISNSPKTMIVSASYKTDIPAFYGDWFLNRLRAGYCMVTNPYNRNQSFRVSLRREDVDGFVFWTKNAGPFLGKLYEVHLRG